jgi:metal-responsive CopG/Arc/MetJ family transcriptional regulator
MRGELTEKVQELAKEYLGREISLTELRLYPFIDYCLKNGGYMDRSKLSREELEMLLGYDADKLQRNHGYIYVSKDFYEYMQKVLWEAYIETKIEVK